MRLVHNAVFDIERGEVFYPVLQLGVARHSQTEQREFAQCGQWRGGAPQQQTDTARMLQQHGHYLAFAFLDQESGEIEYPYIPVAASQRIGGCCASLKMTTTPSLSMNTWIGAVIDTVTAWLQR